MILCCGFLTVLLVVQVRCLTPEGCDPSANDLFHEGILGQVGMFPWLGVIKVELHEGVDIRTALTGAILVKENYALTIADDIARIPRKIFERDSKALFIPNDSEPWLCRLKKYITHPEYTLIQNTIALIELELENKGHVPLVPICWQTDSYTYTAASQLYVLGITDVNDILEKEVNKVKYVQQSECMQWYERTGLSNNEDQSRDYQCVSTVTKKKQCVYETGMVLASNATGTWTLLGFGIYGPGCSSPSRFIEIHKYLPWIESTTSPTERSPPNVPVHELYRSGKTEELSNRIVPYLEDRYETGLAPEVVRIDKNAIILFDSKYEASKGDCFKKSYLIYSDSIKIVADEQQGKAYYQLSMMDLSVMKYTCVLVRVDAEKRKSQTRLWYNFGDFIEALEGLETPKELIKKYPLPVRQIDTKNDTETTTEGNSETTTKSEGDKKPRRVGRRIINNNRRYRKLIADSLINDLLAIKSELETTRKELNITGKADIHKTFKKMLTVKEKLSNVKEKLGGPVPKTLNDSINILDTAASELRAGQVFYQGKLMDVRKQEVQQSIDLIKKFRDQPDIDESEKVGKSAKIKKQKSRGRQGAKKPWKPHQQLEKQYITDRPGWWLYYPHLNLELEFDFDSAAEMTIEVWSHLKTSPPTKDPFSSGPTRTRNSTATSTTEKPSSGQKNNSNSSELDLEVLIGRLEPRNLPQGTKMRDVKALIRNIFPKKLPAGTNRTSLIAMIDPKKLPPEVSLEQVTSLITAQFSENLLPSLRQNIDHIINHAGLPQQFLRKDNFVRIRGIDLDDLEDDSNIIRSDRLCVVMAVVCVVLWNLVAF